MYIVIIFNLEWKGCLARVFGGEIAHVPGAEIKDICLTVYIVLLGYYQIFESQAILSHDHYRSGGMLHQHPLPLLTKLGSLKE